VERSLGLICGAGVLPARMAGEARRQGWRVVAFTFGEMADVSAHADLTIPSRLSEAGVVLATLADERIGAVLFSGKFWLQDYLRESRPDATLAEIETKAGALVDANLVQVVVTMLGQMGIDLLDQRPFLGDWLGGSGCWSNRAPTDAEWVDVRRGLAVARLVADAGVGQTVVVRRGAVAAVEAIEGTTETIRRGLEVAGRGAVVAKAAARGHDYRFDMPTIGPETIEIAAAGGAAVVAVEAERVLVLDREACIRIANGAGMALVGTE
jgi:UDP-2,3-diacylglucosamine hydrolase